MPANLTITSDDHLTHNPHLNPNPEAPQQQVGRSMGSPNASTAPCMGPHRPPQQQVQRSVGGPTASGAPCMDRTGPQATPTAGKEQRGQPQGL